MTGEEENRPDLRNDDIRTIDNDMFEIINTYALTGWLLTDCKLSDKEIIEIVDENGERYEALVKEYSETVKRKVRERKQRRAKDEEN